MPFPVYSSSFISENELVLGGGGGQVKTGVKNKLRLYNVGPERSLDLLEEVELEQGEDAPMSMAAHSKSRTLACGVNSTLESFNKGFNENCRVFTLKDNKPSVLSTRGTIPTVDPEDYQASRLSKVTVLSPDGTLLAVAGAHDRQAFDDLCIQLSLLSYPSLDPLAESIHTENEIYDATFSDSTLVIATTQDLSVYSLPAPPEVPQTPSPKKSKGKGKNKNAKQASQVSPPKLELLHTVKVPAIQGVVSTFRSARWPSSMPDQEIASSIY
ncbi:hypothetical protein DXG01_007938 [Tephrocybe rancida]|nr:hypothetical protein DXG01_007938 [Tephrocybe rancida]